MHFVQVEAEQDLLVAQAADPGGGPLGEDVFLVDFLDLVDFVFLEAGPFVCVDAEFAEHSIHA